MERRPSSELQRPVTGATGPSPARAARGATARGLVAAAGWLLATVMACGCGRSELAVELPCYAPVADCNRLSSDGCEVNLRSDADHCGACGVRCAEGLYCGGGRCVPPETPVQVETNGAVELVRTAGGQVFGWGVNKTGLLLRDSERELNTVWLDVPPLAELRLRADAACGRTFDGEVWCWGDGTVPGNSGPPGEPARVVGLNDPVRLTSWYYGHCALEARGAWKCWASWPNTSTYDSLVIGSGHPVSHPMQQPAEMAALPGFGRDVLTGIAVLADGSGWGWGEPRHAGQPDHLRPKTEPNAVDPPIRLPFLENVEALFGWRERFCAGAAPPHPIECWGAEVLDVSDPDQDGHFTALPAGHYQRLTPSYQHTCGLLRDGQMICRRPQTGIERVGVADIASVASELLVIDLDGKVYCLDPQEKGNCATGEEGWVKSLVEVKPPPMQPGG